MSKLIIATRYGTAPNELLNNPDISFKAKGLYTYMQAKPDGWDFSSTRICKETREGIDSIQSGLKELEEAGYLVREKKKDEDGRWEWVHTLLEKPLLENPVLEKPVIKKAIDKKKYIISEQSSQNESEEIVIVSDLDEEKGRHRRPAKYPNAPAVRKVFQDVLGRNPANWQTNKTQLQACENLYTERGLDKIKSALEYYKANEDADFIPEINSPYCLDSKWSKLGKHKLKNND